jgi:hypothetical protein
LELFGALGLTSEPVAGDHAVEGVVKRLIGGSFGWQGTAEVGREAALDEVQDIAEMAFGEIEVAVLFQGDASQRGVNPKRVAGGFQSEAERVARAIHVPLPKEFETLAVVWHNVIRSRGMDEVVAGVSSFHAAHADGGSALALALALRGGGSVFGLRLRAASGIAAGWEGISRLSWWWSIHRRRPAWSWC